MGWVKSCISNLLRAHLCSGIRRRRKGWQIHLGAIGAADSRTVLISKYNLSDRILDERWIAVILN